MMKKSIDIKKTTGKTDKASQYENKLSSDDLKGKKVDAFPDNEEDKPLDQKKQTATSKNNG